MPCDTIRREAEAQKQYEDALKQLEQDIASGKVIVSLNVKTGNVQISNWGEHIAAKAGWCEGCALAKLGETGSYVVKQKLARWGVKQGRSFIAQSHADHVHKVGGGHK
jgi:hypothetical protein